MKHCLIFNPYNLWDFHLNFEVPVYHNLIDRGYTPIYLRCGLEQKECDLYWSAASGTRPVNACNNCKIQTDSFLKTAGISYYSLSDFIDESTYDNQKNEIRKLTYDELSIFEFMGFRIHDFSISSVFTHLRINQFDPGEQDQLACLREYMIYTIGVLMAGTLLLKRFRPEAALIFNGRTAPTRAFLELCCRQGVRVISHERGLTRGAMNLWLNDSCLSLSPMKKIAEHHLKYPLKPYQVQLVYKWIQERREGINFNFKTFQNSEIHPLKLETKNKLTEWILYTSSMDELSATDQFVSPFGNQYNWIEATCRIALQLQDKVRLTIRVHPNSGSLQSVGVNSEERDYFKHLKANFECEAIRIIDSFDSVNSYKLMDSADLVLVYASTISLEALISRKVVYVASTCPWWHCPGIKSFNSDPDYEFFLKKYADKTECVLERASLVQGLRFAYHLLYSYQVAYPFLEQISTSKNRLVVHNENDFSEGMYPELDFVVEALIGEKDILRSPSGFFDEQDLRQEDEEIDRAISGNRGILFSVVITNYNYAGYIRNCVESVIAQNQENCEIIIVDDGSTDDSRNIIRKLVEDFPNSNIKLLFQENSGQPAISRNNGIKISSGRYILPLDADDMLADGYLQACKNTLSLRPEVNLIAANCFLVYPEKHELGRPGLFNMGNLAQANQIVIASLYSKALWEKVGGYRDNVRGYEDWDMWLNMSMNGAIVAYLDCVGLIYNAKNTGLYEDAKSRHEDLYAQLILNNQAAYRGNLNLVKSAKNHLSQIRSTRHNRG